MCLILITDGAEFPQDICCISVFNTAHSIGTEGPDSVNVLNDLSYGFRCNGILLLAVLFHNSKRQSHFRNEEQKRKQQEVCGRKIENTDQSKYDYRQHPVFHKGGKFVRQNLLITVYICRHDMDILSFLFLRKRG